MLFMHKMTRTAFLCLFSSLCLEQGALLAETWVGGSADWNLAGNWSPASVPNAIDAVATFNAAGVDVINLQNDSITVGTLNFSVGAPEITNTGGNTGTLTMQTSSGNPTVNVISGDPFITCAAPGNFVIASSTLDIVVPTGAAGFLAIARMDLGTNTRTFNVNRGLLPRDLQVLNITNGTMVKEGTGILELLTGNTANLTVNAGTANCGLANAMTGTLTVASGATFDCNGASQSINGINGAGSLAISSTFTVGTAGASGTFSGVISSTGTFNKDGTGTQVLNGSASNTYSGATSTASSGTLVLAKTGGAVAVPTALTIGGTSTVRTDAANQLASTASVTMNAASTFNLNNNNQAIAALSGNNAGATISTGTGAGGILTTNVAAVSTFAGAITQNGGLTKQGTSMLVLTGTNTYTGATTVSAGTLRSGAAGAFPSGSNYTVTTPGVLSLNDNSSTLNSLAGSGSVTLGVNPATTLTTGTASSTFSGVISGSGALTKAGAGTLVLTGINTYSGGTTVSAGVLQGTTDGLQGAIANNASLVFDQPTAGTYPGAITGTGSFTKQNSGALTLTGVNAIGSTTTVAGGALYVNNTLTSTGALTVQSGGTLAGTGPITAPTFTVNGTLSPGNSIDTIFLVGAITQTTGSTLEIEITPSAADLVDITGTYTVQPGATLSILVDPGVYPANYSQTIVTTTGGRSGTFSNVTMSLPTFIPDVIYSANNIVLEIFEIPFSDVISGGNAGAVAACLDTLDAPDGSDELLIQTELRMIESSQELAENLALMQPSQFTALALAQENTTLYVNETLFHRLDQESKLCQENDTRREKPITFWAAPFGGFSNQKKQSGEVGFKNHAEGVAAGMDYHFTKRILFGGALGYSHVDLSWKSSRGHSSMNNGYATLYAGLIGHKGFIYGSFMAGYDSYEEKRKIKFSCDCLTAINRTAKSDHSGWQTSGHIKGGALVDFKSVLVSPFAAFDYLYFHEGSFTEKGASSLNLKVRDKTSDLFVAEGGIEVSKCFSVMRNDVVPSFTFSVLREQRFTGKNYKSSFVGSSCVMHTKGMNPNRTLLSPAFALTFLIPDAARTLSFQYKGKFGSHYSDQNFLAEFLLRF